MSNHKFYIWFISFAMIACLMTSSVEGGFVAVGTDSVHLELVSGGGTSAGQIEHGERNSHDDSGKSILDFTQEQFQLGLLQTSSGSSSSSSVSPHNSSITASIATSVAIPEAGQLIFFHAHEKCFVPQSCIVGIFRPPCF